jgi:uncharacterized protein (DUF433 family)
MSKTYVMTVRLSKDLGVGLERYAARTGHKAAQLGALAVDEFMRRQSFPLIDFRETAAGRVAYVKGTRLAVYWLVDAIRRIKGNLALAAESWELTPEKVRMALHYAETYPKEIQTMRQHAKANREWLEKGESAMKKARALERNPKQAGPKAKPSR